MDQDDADVLDLDLDDDDDSSSNRPRENMLTSLPSKSKEVYELRYNHFLNWLKEKDTKTPYSEECLLTYFVELSRKTSPSTLWTNYSMLRATLGVYQNVDIAKYVKLRTFLKRKAKGYKPKKSKMLTTHEINKFLQDAPDDKYLLHKVALIVALSCACRKHQLLELKVTDIEYLGASVLIKMNHPRSGKQQLFSISGEYYRIFKKYADLRPANVEEKRFFLNYQNLRCTRQPVGINKFGGMPKQIASFLGLKDPQSYTGHCFKKSSTTMVVDSSGEVAALRQRLRWEPPPNDLRETPTNTVKGVESTALTNESSCSSSSYSNRSVPNDGNYGVDGLPLPRYNSEVNLTTDHLPPPTVYTGHHHSPDEQPIAPPINYFADALPCPPRVNDSAGQQRKHEATKIFSALCPETMRVKAVYPNLGMGKYCCSWRVDYEDCDNGQNLTNEQIMTKLEARRPHYSKMIFVRKSIIPPLWSVEYGILDCQCRDGIFSKPSENGMCYYNDVNFDIVPKSEDMDLNVYDSYE